MFTEFARQPHAVWLEFPGASLLAATPRRIVTSLAELPGALKNFRGYAIGYFAYDLKNELERLPSRAVDDIGLPKCWFGFYDNVHQKSSGGASVPACDNSRFASRDACATNKDSFIAAVLRAKEYIAAGDVYQVNLSQRFQCEVNVSAPELYRTLRETNPAPYCAYLDIGDAQILSSSPECFLHIRNRHVVTRPIKGTRPRAADPKELLNSPKDNAELLMITDLERNDLGKVCEFGSVRVSEMKRIESYATVHHLVSTVEGTLRKDVSHVDCIRACFPGGSITGAPKIRAMEIIDELEPHARGVYCGAIGYFGPNGESHFNIAIRTAVYQRWTRRAEATDGREGGRLTFHTGAGIVADSEPEAEYEETLAKAQGIINALDQLRLR